MCVFIFTAVIQLPFRVKLLAENLSWRFQVQNADARSELKVLLDQLPKLAVELETRCVRVDVEIFRPVITIGRLKTDVITKREFRLVEPDQVDDIRNDEVVGARFVVDTVKYGAVVHGLVRLGILKGSKCDFNQSSRHH